MLTNDRKWIVDHPQTLIRRVQRVRSSIGYKYCLASLFLPSLLFSLHTEALATTLSHLQIHMTQVTMSTITSSSSYCSPAPKRRWVPEGLYSDTSSDMLNYVAGDFHKSPTRSTNSIFGPSPSLPSPPSPRSRRQPTLRTPIVHHPGRWLRAAESPRRRRQPRIRSSPTPGPAPFHYRRASSVESPCRMPTVSPLPLVESPPPQPRLKAFSRAKHVPL